MSPVPGPLQVLHLHERGDEPQRVKAALDQEGLACETTWVHSRAAFGHALLDGWRYDLILADPGCPDCPGRESLALAQGACPATPFFLLGAPLAAEDALERLREGATECLDRADPGRLCHAARRALDAARQAGELRAAREDGARAAALLRATLETTPEGLLITAMAGQVAAYNQRLVELSGLPREALAAMDLDRVILHLQDHFKDPDGFLAETRLLAERADGVRDGLVKALSGQVLEGVERVFGGAGGTAGRVITFRDVTRRERIAEALAGQVARSRNLLEAARAGQVVPWRLQADVLTFPEEEAGDLPGDLPALLAGVHPEDADGFRQALAAPRGATVDLRLARDGAWVRTRWRIEPDGAGGHQGVFLKGTGLGLTEAERSRLLEAQVRAAAERVRGPLALLGNRLGLLAGSRALGDVQRRHLEAAASALAVLEDLLARMEGGSPAAPAPPGELDLNGFLEGLRPRAEAALPGGLRLRTRFEAGLPALAVPAGQLEPVVLALIHNARDAMGGAGEILLATGACPGGAFLEVEDRGPGLAPEVRERMFDPFFTTREGAAGLGLFVARSQVERCGGSLRGEGCEAGGARFRVELPARAS